MVKFGDVVLDTKGKVDRTNNPYDYYIAGDHMDTEDLELHRKGCFATDDVGPAFVRTFKPGQVLYGSRRTYLKKVTVADFEGVTANTTFVFETKDASVLSQELLPFIMWSDKFTDFSILKSRGSTNPYVLFSDLAEYEFDLPDLAKQEELAELLWSMEYTKRAYRKMIAQTDELVKSQFIELFGDTKNPKYPIVRLKELTDVCSGGTPDRKTAEYWESGNIPWVKTTELQNNVLTTTEEFITESGLLNSSAKIVPSNTILIAMYGQGKTRGMTAFLGVEACTNQACACILPTNKIDMLFLWQYFILSYNELRNLAKGSNQANLNAGQIKNFLVPLPPLEAQMEFRVFVEQLDKSKFELQKALDELTAMQKKIIEQNLT